jgi:hypothetical protein
MTNKNEPPVRKLTRGFFRWYEMIKNSIGKAGNKENTYLDS